MSEDAAGVIARFQENFEGFLRLRRTVHPEALYFGPLFSVRLAVEAIRVAGKDPTFTPAFMVADAMLCRGGHSDYAAEIRARHGPIPRPTQELEDELRGYVETVALYTAASWAHMVERAKPSEVAAILDRSPTFNNDDHVTPWLRSRARTFVEVNAVGALLTGSKDDALNPEPFMDRCVLRARGAGFSTHYQRGVRTARDTMVVFTELLTAFLASQSDS